MKKAFFLILLMLSMILTCSCAIGSDGGNNDKGDGEDEKGEEGGYSVVLLCSDGITVEGDNPVTVKEGENATFKIKHTNNVVIQEVSDGSYNYDLKTVTVPNVTSDMRVTLTGEKTDCDTSVICDYVFMGKSKYDTTSRRNDRYSLGVDITVNAGLETRSFVGWSIGATLEYGGTLVSREREYGFSLSADMLKDGVLYLYPNYSDTNVVYYDPNGGMINGGTDNMNLSSPYYSLDIVDYILKVSLSKGYYDATGCASTFYDDGTFTRTGYVLKEYNTAPDGSGEGYSLGSKFPLNLSTSTLYCIWSPDSDHADFEYENISIPLPSGVSRSNAPHWIEDGVIVTKYNGNDGTVTIPETLGGKTVIAIAEGAFENKDMTTLVMGRRIIRVEDGAFTNCSSLKTIHYPDGIYDISNDAFDTASFEGVKNFYVNATIAPRYSNTLEGAYALKLTRLLYNSDMKRIIVIAGSSAFQGLSTEYLEALLDGEYCVVNFGTTRTTQGTMYLEAMGALADSDDIVLYAPENSAYMMGEPRLYWKTLRDLEGLYNIFRHVDISGYSNVIGAFAEFNKGDPDAYEPLATPRYKRAGQDYEAIIGVSNINVYGEYILPSERESYVNDSKYQDVYKLTFNHRFKSIKEGAYMNSDPNEDYYTSENWCDVTDPYYKDNMNRVINAAKSGGAKILFTFCPADGAKISDEVRAGGEAWLTAYDNMILGNYTFDGILGSSASYVYNHKYFYNNAFHLNDYGRTWRTYDMYKDLASLLGISKLHGVRELGTDFEGCLFEVTADNEPLYKSDVHFEQ